jgi:hypothetical protein
LGLVNEDASYSDNFIHLLPAKPQSILVQPKSTMSLEVFLKNLQVRSLFDTYLPV